MAKYVKPLSDAEIKRMKPESKLYRKSDGQGLSIKIMPSGAKIWEYRFINPETKKEDTLVIGDYPTISLAQARVIHQEKRALVLQDINPKRSNDDKKFSAVFEEWYPSWASEKKNPDYAIDSYKAIKNDCMKTIGNMNTDDIEPKHILECLQPFVKRRALGRIPKIKTILKQVFDYAVVKGLARFNPVLSVPNTAFPKHESKGHRTLDYNHIYMVHGFFNEYKGTAITAMAVELLMRTMTRAQETCKLKWEDVDFEKKWIVIPEKIMKKNNSVIIPMCIQVELLMKSLYKLTGNNEYVFPGVKSGHIYTKTPTRALARFNVDTTSHGFRTLASTVLYETLEHNKSNRLIIEACLSHKEKDQSAAAYNKAQYINGKLSLYQWWSDFIDMCDTEENNLKALKKFNII